MDQELEKQTMPAGDSVLSIEELIRENLKVSQENRIILAKLQRYMAWQQIYAWVRFLVIIIPILAAAFYLPPLLQDVYSQWSSLLSEGGL